MSRALDYFCASHAISVPVDPTPAMADLAHRWMHAATTAEDAMRAAADCADNALTACEDGDHDNMLRHCGNVREWQRVGVNAAHDSSEARRALMDALRHSHYCVAPLA